MKIKIKEWDSQFEDPEGDLYFRESGTYFYKSDRDKCGKILELNGCVLENGDFYFEDLDHEFHRNGIGYQMFEVMEGEKI